MDVELFQCEYFTGCSRSLELPVILKGSMQGVLVLHSCSDTLLKLLIDIENNVRKMRGFLGG